ncbi:MAG: formylglycine-generating enzyme family protein [Neisseriaceae bacterium]|nr:MAG: formylglycine-generating enzyme family protein [Neisseriaceae bacterium]
MDINKLSSREAMGLSNTFSLSKKDNLSSLFEALRGYERIKLLDIVENVSYDILHRYVAGRLLAISGDSRISTLNPMMMDIPESEVRIGINESHIDHVMKCFPDIGLKREWILKETPSFSIEINAFRCSKYLVTNQDFRVFLDDTKYEELPSSWEFGIYPEYKSNSPVYSVSFSAASEYVKWLSLKTNRKFRLLTEYEWEYMASGPVNKEFPWGNTLLYNNANTLESGFLTSTPVGIFTEGNSPFGICDVAGNVEEYVSCDYKPYSNSQYIHDDIALELGNYKVCRGGSFTRYLDLARCSRRHGAYPKDIYVIGFRVAEDI